MSTIIFDLDGTLADISHRLHYIKGEKKNWDAFHWACAGDKPKNEIFRLFYELRERGVDRKIFIASGRNDLVRRPTVDWLEINGIEPGGYQLIMRENGDGTPDEILKEKWLLEGRFGPIKDIWLVFDDRQRVVDMWRRNGLTCLQVAAWTEE